VLTAAAHNPGRRYRRRAPAHPASPRHSPRSNGLTQAAVSHPGGAKAREEAAHTRPTDVPQRSRAHSPEAIHP
jgi:hypothetical protein